MGHYARTRLAAHDRPYTSDLGQPRNLSQLYADSYWTSAASRLGVIYASASRSLLAASALPGFAPHGLRADYATAPEYSRSVELLPSHVLTDSRCLRASENTKDYWGFFVTLPKQARLVFLPHSQLAVSPRW